jgi:hypothetical protein
METFPGEDYQGLPSASPCENDSSGGELACLWRQATRTSSEAAGSDDDEKAENALAALYQVLKLLHLHYINPNANASPSSVAAPKK